MKQTTLYSYIIDSSNPYIYVTNVILFVLFGN